MKQQELSKILRNLNILYVDSDFNSNRIMIDLLSIQCSKFFCAVSVLEGLKMYEKEHIDIIITEIKFKDQEGFKLIEEIRKKNKSIPFIVITSVQDTQCLLKAIRLNLIEYIIKPLEMTLFQDAIFRAAQSVFENGNYLIHFDKDVSYDIRKKTLLKQNKQIPLTKHEIALLDSLVDNRANTLTKEQLKYFIWEDNFEISDEAFKSLLSRLRSKIGKKCIKNISGVGYSLDFE